MPRTFPFVWVDVFARSPLEGNQLAVFPDANGLPEEEMPRITREMNLSETTFVFPEGNAVDREQGYRTRIFAVQEELPFAGHPTLGTADVLRQATGASDVALRLKAGRIPVRFSTRDGRSFGEMVQNEPVVGATHDPKLVAKALGVAKGDLDTTVPVQTVSTGMAFAIVPFRSLETLAHLRPDPRAMEEYLHDSDAKLFYLVTRQTVDPSAGIHARMFIGAKEDPATGSAAGTTAAWMVLNRWAKPEQTVVIEQGIELQRRSFLYVTAGTKDGRPTRVRVGGHCAAVIRGEIVV